MEDINFSMKELQSSQQEVSIMFYMQKIFPGYNKVGLSIIFYFSSLGYMLLLVAWVSFLIDEWKNFLERMDGLKDEGKEEDLRNWASFRGQTLSRTVRGMMYYREALKMQAFLDVAEKQGL